MIKALLIEDDGLWRSKLQVMLDELEVSVTATTENVKDTLRYLERERPDVIIADILLHEETVFKVFEHKAIYWQIPTILITQSDKEIHFKQTHKFNRVLYIVKPIHKLTLKSALDQVCEAYSNKQNQEHSLLLKGNKNERIRLPISLIHYIEQRGNYCHIITEKKEFVFKKSLSKILLELDNQFIHIHRSFCINTNQVKAFNTSLDKVKMKINVELPIGRIYKNRVKEFLAKQYLS